MDPNNSRVILVEGCLYELKNNLKNNLGLLLQTGLLINLCIDVNQHFYTDFQTLFSACKGSLQINICRTPIRCEAFGVHAKFSICRIKKCLYTLRSNRAILSYFSTSFTLRCTNTNTNYKSCCYPSLKTIVILR